TITPTAVISSVDSNFGTTTPLGGYLRARHPLYDGGDRYNQAEVHFIHQSRRRVLRRKREGRIQNYLRPTQCKLPHPTMLAVNFVVPFVQDDCPYAKPPLIKWEKSQRELRFIVVK